MNALQRLAGGAATAFALFALTAPAFAGGSIKDRPAEPRRCTFSANAALATEYVFRGFSQTAQGPAIQGGFDATCGIFYAGVWASNLDFGVVTVGGPDQVVANIEIDAYAGVKFTTGKLAWDVGIIYYGYPNQASALTA
ncbi:MAG TPA: TorF family putative porin, partial [Burkholderiales bacterium]|nr:TorF family putative porin [Burkholderiales bacterium]